MGYKIAKLKLNILNKRINMYQDYMNNINKQKYGFNEEIDLNKK